MPCTRRLAATLVALLGLAASLLAQGERRQPLFFPDDPIARFPEPGDASGVSEQPASQGFDFVENTLLQPGERVDRRAMNVNTLDEVPDSSWFTNRIGSRAMTLEELGRGPDESDGPAPGRWRLRAGKSSGITPGFRMRDRADDLYFVKFDPPGHLEMATGAEVISTKILHALGYNVPENYVVNVRREDLDITEARLEVGGRERPMTDEDLDRLLAKAAANADGSYRVLASKALSGTPVGPFRYYGTRPDDPNDIVPHEHRRELRGMRVFAAWLNHMDSRGINSLDTLAEAGDRKLVRHHLLDFGSTLGSAAVWEKSRRSGHEYLWDVSESLLRGVTLGLRVPAWTRIPFPDHPSIGRIEADHFEPAAWVPHYPNPAFDNARPDDTFWAARRVMAFSDEAIRAVVRTGRISDPEAERYLGDVLMARRDRIGRAWLTNVNPIVDPTLSADGVLRFGNAAVEAGVATSPAEYRLAWAIVDNASGEVTPVGAEQASAAAEGRAPADLIARRPSYIRVAVAAVHPDHEVWRRPVYVYFRRIAGGWEAVGLERLPEGSPGAPVVPAGS